MHENCRKNQSCVEILRYFITIKKQKIKFLLGEILVIFLFTLNDYIM